MNITPKTRRRSCAECTKDFYGWQGRAKYCSKKCSNAVSTRRATQHRLRSIEVGHIFGRPIQNHIYARYKKSAENKLRLFDLTQEEFNLFWQKPCNYCGSEIKTIGLDRLDSSLGYSKENVVPCCTECNMMKRGMSLPGFISHCKKVANKSEADFVAKHNLSI